jgi:glycosyltransferase involved in cell wall biosynthesis
VKIEICTTQFPEKYETFIANEIEVLALEHDIEILTFKKSSCRDFRVHYLFWANPFHVLFFFFYIFSKPREMGYIFKELWTGFKNCPRSFERMKSFLLWPLACHRAFDLKKAPKDLLWAHWSNVPSTVIWILHRLTGIPFVMEIHGENMSRFWPHLKIKCQDALQVISCTRFNEQRLKKNNSSLSVIYLPHGCRLNSKKIIIKHFDSIRGLTVGRLVPTKGHDTLLQALALLQKEGVDFSWTLVGEGPEKKKLQRMINVLDLKEKIHCIDYVNPKDLKSFYKTHSVFVLPLRESSDGDSDGLPNVILEAMAAACPVITSPVAETARVFCDRENILFSKTSHPESLKETLLEIHSNKDLRKKVIHQADHFVRENYSFESCHERILRLARKLDKIR